MTKKKTESVTVNDKEYNPEDLNQEQVVLLRHMVDLQRKINSTEFNLEQLKVGLSAFVTRFEMEG